MVSAPPLAPARTLAATCDTRGGMAEAGGAGPPALPPAPPHGSPRTLATASGSSASCGPATAVAAAGTAEGPGGGGSARIAVKKAQLRSAPRAKKLEKLGVYSACKVPAGTRATAGSRPGPDPSSPLPSPTPLGPLAGTAEVLHSLRALRRCGLHSVPQGWGLILICPSLSSGNDESWLPSAGGYPGALLLCRSSRGTFQG